MPPVIYSLSQYNSSKELYEPVHKNSKKYGSSARQHEADATHLGRKNIALLQNGVEPKTIVKYGRMPNKLQQCTQKLMLHHLC